MATVDELFQNQRADEERLNKAKKGSEEYKKIQDRIKRRYEAIADAVKDLETWDGSSLFPSKLPSERINLPDDDATPPKPSKKPPLLTEPATTSEPEGFGLSGITQAQAAQSYVPGIEAGLNKPLTAKEDFLPGSPAYQLGLAQANVPEVAGQYGMTFGGKGYGPTQMFKYLPVTPEVQDQIDIAVFGSPQAKEKYFAPGGLGETVSTNRGITLEQLKTEMIGTGQGYAVDNTGTIYLTGGRIVSPSGTLLKPTVGNEATVSKAPVFTSSAEANAAGTGFGKIDVTGGANVPGANTVTSGANVTAALGTPEAVNARAIFNSLFKEYFNRPGDDAFIKSLTTAVEDYIAKGYTEDTIRALLPQTEAYKSRFAGNKGRQAAGLAVYSPAQYLQAEDTYAEILNRFNLGKLATREQFAELISERKSANEVVDLVQNVYDRIRYADTNLKAQLKTLEEFNISESDLAASILSGDKTAQELKRKIAGAEVATEAGIRGLSTTRAQELANLGVTREQARTGFEAIAQTAPTLTKLGQIYGSPATAADQQTELEKEQFQGLASERRKRLAEQEQTAFMGRSGTANISLGRRTPGSI